MSSRGFRRQRGDVDVDLFGTSTPTSATSKDADEAIFGTQEIERMDISERPVIKLVGIFEIFPDTAQPRRAVPSSVRHFWSGEPDGLGRLFDMWIKTIQQERGDSFDLYDYLNQDGSVENAADRIDVEEDASPSERALLSLAQLAISIKSIGLTNAITVAETGRTYRLETGERRWMAYHLLNHYFDDGKWTKIPARVFKQADIWRQAAENSARADLNAIAKARQLAILLMHMLQQEKGAEFQSFEAIINSGRSEREYYAQVADGEGAYRIPHKQTEKLVAAMGLKQPSQIRQYRMLLRRSDAEWTTADDYDLTEWEIRSGKLDEIMKRKNRAESVTSRNAISTKVRDDVDNPFVESVNKKRHSKIWTYANRLDTMTDEQRTQALDDIRAEMRWLEELEQAMRSRSEDD